MASRLLITHRQPQDFAAIKTAFLVEQRLRIGRYQPRKNSLPQNARLRKPPDGIKRQARNRSARPHDIGYDRDQRHIMPGKTDQRVRDIAFERNAYFTNFNYFQCDAIPDS